MSYAYALTASHGNFHHQLHWQLTGGLGLRVLGTNANVATTRQVSIQPSVSILVCEVSLVFEVSVDEMLL